MKKVIKNHSAMTLGKFIESIYFVLKAIRLNANILLNVDKVNNFHAS